MKVIYDIGNTSEIRSVLHCMRNILFNQINLFDSISNTFIYKSFIEYNTKDKKYYLCVNLFTLLHLI